MRVATESEADLFMTPVPPNVTWTEFYGCRNAIVRALADLGTVGPSGTIDISAGESDDWFPTDIAGVSDPDYFIVDDMYNDLWRGHRIEIDRSKLTEASIMRLGSALAAFPHWYVEVALGDSIVTIFADRIVPYGRRFWDCETMACIARRAATRLDYGAAPTFWDSGYEIWLELICDRWSSHSWPEPSDRQWAAVLKLLAKQPRVSKFTYIGRVSTELHPQTRLEHILRFLRGLQSLTSSTQIALHTVSADSGILLAELGNQMPTEMLDLLTAAQLGLAHIDKKGAFFFWGTVQHGISQHPEVPPQQVAVIILGSHLHQIMERTNSELIRLSALLGLATLRDPNIAEVAAQVANEKKWPAEINKWLNGLERSASGYPLGEWDFDSLS